MGQDYFFDTFRSAVLAGNVPVNPVADADYLTTASMRAGWDLIEAQVCPEDLAGNYMLRMTAVVQSQGSGCDLIGSWDAVVAYINDNLPRSDRTKTALAARNAFVAPQVDAMAQRL